MARIEQPGTISDFGGCDPPNTSAICEFCSLGVWGDSGRYTDELGLDPQSGIQDHSSCCDCFGYFAGLAWSLLLLDHMGEPIT